MTAPPEEHIRRTIARYSMLCDDGRFDEWGNLFTTDARFHVMGTTHQGRGEVQSFIEAAQPQSSRGKHLTSDSLIRVDSWNGSAQVWTDYIFVDRDGKVTSQGRYHDVMARGGDKTWRFTLREIVFRGASPELTDEPPPQDRD